MGRLACEQNHLSPNTGSDNTIQPLVFSIDDGDKVKIKMIVPNLGFGTVLPAWQVGRDALMANNCFSMAPIENK